MPHIHHLTITTGRSNRSERADVSDAALAIMAPWLDSALAAGSIVPLPAETEFGARCLSQDGALVVTVYAPKPDIGPQLPMVTFGVAQRSRQGAALWPVLLAAWVAAPGLRQPQAPWCAVHLHPTAAVRPDALRWLGDFERCVAWVWITRRPQLEPAR